MKAINARWHPDKKYSSETVSEQHDENGKFLPVVATMTSTVNEDQEHS